MPLTQRSRALHNKQYTEKIVWGPESLKAREHVFVSVKRNANMRARQPVRGAPGGNPVGIATWPSWAGGATSALEAGAMQAAGHPDTEAKGTERNFWEGEERLVMEQEGLRQLPVLPTEAPAVRGGASPCRERGSPEELTAGPGAPGVGFSDDCCAERHALPGSLAPPLSGGGQPVFPLPLLASGDPQH